MLTFASRCAQPGRAHLVVLVECRHPSVVASFPVRTSNARQPVHNEKQTIELFPHCYLTAHKTERFRYRLLGTIAAANLMITLTPRQHQITSQRLQKVAEIKRWMQADINCMNLYQRVRGRRDSTTGQRCSQECDASLGQRNAETSPAQPSNAYDVRRTFQSR